MFAKGHNIEKWLFYNLQKQNKPIKKNTYSSDYIPLKDKTEKKKQKKKSKLKESVHIMPNRYVTVSCRVKSEIQSSLCKQTPCHIFVVRLFTCTYALYIEPNCVMYIFI